MILSVVPLSLPELLQGFEFFSLSEDGDVGEDDGDDDFDGNLSSGRLTSRGRAKGSWLAWKYLRQRRAENPEWTKRSMEMKPNMLILSNL
jgi:hypothetical protein